MRKREFLRELRVRLEKVNCRDIDDIIEYYDELIEDTIERTGKKEEDVIYDLGPIHDIVVRVSQSKNDSSTDDMYEEKIRYDEYEETNDKRNRSVTTEKKKKSGSTILLGVIIVILTSPFWLGILTGFLGLILGVIGAGIGIGLAGIACVIYGCFSIGASLGNALFQIGIGIMLIGGTLILAPIIVKMVAWLCKLVLRFVRWLLGISSKRRECYEN